MVKAPVKRKQKQKIKQKVKVSQNVKVVIGDVKRKHASKSSGAKSGGSAKPPIVLNISNPQPYNNMFMEYFKKQLQNQQPIQANTLSQQEQMNEREETKASKAGALHSLDQEPNDVAREMRRLKIEQVERIRQADEERKEEEKEMKLSIRKIPKSTSRRAGALVSEYLPHHTPKVEQSQMRDPEQEMLQAIEQQRLQAERAIEKQGGAGADDDEGYSGERDVPRTPVRQYKESAKPIKEVIEKKRGRKPLGEEVIQARLMEEARLRREMIGMEAEDKPRRGPKRLTQEQKEMRKRERELSKVMKKASEGNTESEN